MICVYGYLTSALAAWDKLRLLETTFKAFLLEVFNKHDLTASISTIILYSLKKLETKKKVKFKIRFDSIYPRIKI